jgi:hypothetical protein
MVLSDDSLVKIEQEKRDLFSHFRRHFLNCVHINKNLYPIASCKLQQQRNVLEKLLHKI